ncbi:hypothetical protein DID76_04245 [Candidatus Marinamargulisbacteria bacterium SCGC AG-414-C22]|nr:hypothetical protein DID76_04245 [Candidatus Marinamargulisbacteria bacterium SCGC AG-414-C22]
MQIHNPSQNITNLRNAARSIQEKTSNTTDITKTSNTTDVTNTNLQQSQRSRLRLALSSLVKGMSNLGKKVSSMFKSSSTVAPQSTPSPNIQVLSAHNKVVIEPREDSKITSNKTDRTEQGIQNLANHGLEKELAIALKTVDNLDYTEKDSLKKALTDTYETQRAETNIKKKLVKKNNIGGFTKLIAETMAEQELKQSTGIKSKMTWKQVLTSPIKSFKNMLGFKNKTGLTNTILKQIKKGRGEIGEAAETARYNVLENQEWTKQESSFTSVSGKTRTATLEFANQSANETSSDMGFSCSAYKKKGTKMKSCAANKTTNEKLLATDALANDARSCLKTEDGKTIIDIQTHSVATAAELKDKDRDNCLQNKAKSFLRSAITTELRKCAEQNGGTLPKTLPPLLLDIASHSLMSSVKGEEHHFMTDQKEVMSMLKKEIDNTLLTEVQAEFKTSNNEVLKFGEVVVDTHMTQHGVNEGEWFSRSTHESEFNQEALPALFEKANTVLTSTTELLKELTSKGDTLKGGPKTKDDINTFFKQKIKAATKKVKTSKPNDKKAAMRKLKFLNECKAQNFESPKYLTQYLELKQHKMTGLKDKIETINTRILFGSSRQVKVGIHETGIKGKIDLLRQTGSTDSSLNETNIFELPVYEAMLAKECGMHIGINCMSGKDRTGEMADQLMMLADKLETASASEEVDTALSYFSRTDFNEKEQKVHKSFKEHSGRQKVTELNTGFSTQKTGAKAPGGLDKILPMSKGITARDANLYGSGTYGHEFDNLVGA